MASDRDAATLISKLVSRAETISVAESLTGGGLGAALTAIPGSSSTFLGGVIAYQGQVKRDLLGVSQKLIDEYGVVSQEVAMAMAQGARKIFGSTWGIATTGVAGPDEVDGLPTGTVWLAICGPINQSTQLHLPGEREVVRNATVSSAITTFAGILNALQEHRQS